MSKGTWVTSGYCRGDLLILNFGKGIAHIGMCTGVNANGTLVTIEGNTGATNDENGGAVMRRTRNTSQVVGACRPVYPNGAAIKKVIDILEGELGVTESPAGSNKVKYNTWYYGREVSGSNYSWCVVLLAWVFNEAGMFDLFMGGQKTASCTALAVYYGYGKTLTSESVGKVTITLCILKPGSSGAQVATLQRLLNALEYFCGKADGEFGPRTEAAVNAFQKNKGLSADGIVGTNTWTMILG